jgi:hypothetical protein
MTVKISIDIFGDAELEGAFIRIIYAENFYSMQMIFW